MKSEKEQDCYTKIFVQQSRVCFCLNTWKKFHEPCWIVLCWVECDNIDLFQQQKKQQKNSHYNYSLKAKFNKLRGHPTFQKFFWSSLDTLLNMSFKNNLEQKSMPNFCSFNQTNGATIQKTTIFYHILSVWGWKKKKNPQIFERIEFKW